MPRIVTVTGMKGGIGKTETIYNYAAYLAFYKDYKVLCIDVDHQCNLTTRFMPLTNENTIKEVFIDPELAAEVKVHNVANNIDLIPSYIELDTIQSNMENISNKEMKLYMWLKNNYDRLNIDQYDFILIDTHPDFATITKNAIAISDFLITPLKPAKDGYEVRFNVENRLDKFRKDIIDFNTGESYIDAKLYFVANQVKHNTNSSRSLKKVAEEDDLILGIIPDKELINKASLEGYRLYDPEVMSELYKQKDNQSFYDTMTKTFDNFTKIFLGEEV